MKSLNLTLIKSFAALLVFLAAIIAFGFLIGGEAGLLFYLIIAGFVLLSMLFIGGKSILKKDNIMLIVLIIAVCCYFGSGIYTFFNNNFDTNPKRTYTAVVTNVPNTRWFDESVFFLNPEGEEKEYYEFIHFDLLNISGRYFEDGDQIYVEEYEGAFGVEHYKIEKVGE